MRYLSKEKDFKYHVKSFVATFVPIFIGLLTALYINYDFKSINPQELTISAIGAGLLSFLRSAFVLLLVAVQMALKKK